MGRSLLKIEEPTSARLLAAELLSTSTPRPSLAEWRATGHLAVRRGLREHGSFAPLLLRSRPILDEDTYRQLVYGVADCVGRRSTHLPPIVTPEIGSLLQRLDSQSRGGVREGIERLARSLEEADDPVDACISEDEALWASLCAARTAGEEAEIQALREFLRTNANLHLESRAMQEAAVREDAHYASLRTADIFARASEGFPRILSEHILNRVLGEAVSELERARGQSQMAFEFLASDAPTLEADAIDGWESGGAELFLLHRIGKDGGALEGAVRLGGDENSRLHAGALAGSLFELAEVAAKTGQRLDAERDAADRVVLRFRLRTISPALSGPERMEKARPILDALLLAVRTASHMQAEYDAAASEEARALVAERYRRTLALPGRQTRTRRAQGRSAVRHVPREVALENLEARNLAEERYGETAFAPAEWTERALRKPERLSAQRLRTWLDHPDERVPIALVERRQRSVGANDPFAEWFDSHFPHLLSRALEEARRDGEVWTPLLDALAQVAHTNPDSAKRLAGAVARFSRWVETRNSQSDMEPAFRFGSRAARLVLAGSARAIGRGTLMEWMRDPEMTAVLLGNPHLSAHDREWARRAAVATLCSADETEELDLFSHSSAHDKHSAVEPLLQAIVAEAHSLSREEVRRLVSRAREGGRDAAQLAPVLLACPRLTVEERRQLAFVSPEATAAVNRSGNAKPQKRRRTR